MKTYNFFSKTATASKSWSQKFQFFLIMKVLFFIFLFLKNWVANKAFFLLQSNVQIPLIWILIVLSSLSDILHGR